jgi:hypothetical protein
MSGTRPVSRFIVCRLRSLVKTLSFLYLAVQLLLAVPAGAAAAPMGTHQAPCGQMAGVPAHDHHCPCCPDGASSMKDCLASCTLSAMMPISSLPVPDLPRQANVAWARVFTTPWVSEPPLKPPPIS